MKLESYFDKFIIRFVQFLEKNIEKIGGRKLLKKICKKNFWRNMSLFYEVFSIMYEERFIVLYYCEIKIL